LNCVVTASYHGNGTNDGIPESYGRNDENTDR
jgi:hypothetical protein